MVITGWVGDRCAADWGVIEGLMKEGVDGEDRVVLGAATVGWEGEIEAFAPESRVRETCMKWRFYCILAGKCNISQNCLHCSRR